LDQLTYAVADSCRSRLIDDFRIYDRGVTPQTDIVVTRKAKGLAVSHTVSLFCLERYWLKLATLYQIVESHSFARSVRIAIKSVKTSAYDNWPRNKQTLKTAIFGHHPCARTGWQD